MDSELIKKARAVMQGISAEQSAKTPADMRWNSGQAVSVQTILVEHSEDEVVQIVDIWRRLFGFSESRAHIKETLRNCTSDRVKARN